MDDRIKMKDMAFKIIDKELIDEPKRIQHVLREKKALKALAPYP